MSFLKTLNTALDAVSRTNRYIDYLTTLSPMLEGQGQSPVKDPAGSMTAHQHDLSSANRLEFGMIVDAIPNAKTYRVQPEAGGPTTDCTLGMQGAATPVGVWDAQSLPVGTHVWFIRTKATGAGGLIVCTAPMYMTDPREYFGDTISQGSNTGLHVESGYDGPLALGGTQGPMKLYGGITDWSGRAPFDSMEIGELNKSTETGLMLHMDPYMAFMRVNEWSGLWMFYWDGLVRLGAQNYQQYAGACVHEIYDDEGEHVWYYGTAVYPWENMGQPKGYASAWWKENSADETQNNSPWYARIEPDQDDIQAYHRLQEYRGYLGQGQSTWMTGPVYSGGQSVLEYSDNYDEVGLHQDAITLSGHRAIRGALGTTITKRPVMPVPKRVKRVEDETADKASNYRASGESTWGAGPQHLVQPTPDPYSTITDEEHSLHKCAAIMDLHAHMFNWENTHPYHYHTQDYYYPEESGYAHMSTNQQVPSWSELRNEDSWYLDTPTATEIQIDHRQNMTADVYPNTSYFSLLDEGGVVIGDGFGAEIRMAGGCVWITAPGDILMETGRNVMGWAGRDVIWRAHDNVDITATDADVRIKAEYNVQIISNTTSQAGIFLDCRSEGDPKYDFSTVGEGAYHTGIIMKAPNTEIVGWGQSIYMRTGIPSGKHDGVSTVGSIPKKGDICLDALGKSDIVTRSEFVKHFVRCAVAHIFRDKGGRAVNFFTEEGATMCGDVYNDGDHVSFGSVITKKDFLTSEGHFFSSAGGYVSKLDSASAGTIADAIQAGHSHELALITWSVQRYNIDLATMWYGEGRPGNEDLIKSAWTSLRVEDDYYCKSFFHFENRWQQMARLGGAGGTTTWTEISVETNKTGAGSADITDTMPFPGYNKLEDETDILYHQGLNLYQHSTGRAVNRGVAYESTVDLNNYTSTKMNGNYIIIN